MENILMRRCPRFIRCSAPKCPLDRDKDKRSYIRGEPKCTLGKDILNKIMEVETNAR